MSTPQSLALPTHLILDELLARVQHKVAYAPTVYLRGFEDLSNTKQDEV
jgi:hypothetical protein